jgi:hypothetical protein
MSECNFGSMSGGLQMISVRGLSPHFLSPLKQTVFFSHSLNNHFLSKTIINIIIKVLQN